MCKPGRLGIQVVILLATGKWGKERPTTLLARPIPSITRLVCSMASGKVWLMLRLHAPHFATGPAACHPFKLKRNICKHIGQFDTEQMFVYNKGV